MTSFFVYYIMGLVKKIKGIEAQFLYADISNPDQYAID
jgi:hypothetical protein